MQTFKSLEPALQHQFVTRQFGLLLALLSVALFGSMSVATAVAAEPRGEAHVYKTVGDRALKIYVTTPKTDDGGRPAIVFFHGGGWVGGAPGQFTEHSDYFASRGLVCFQVEYRLLDRKSNDPPTACINDAKSAMRWVRSNAQKFGVDPKRIAAAGGSAGGHLAAFVGLAEGIDDPKDNLDVSPKANALLLFNPVYENGPKGWGHKRVGDRYREFSPFHNIGPGDPPAIVFLGTEDKLIPVATAEAFKKKLAATGAMSELHLYEGQPHGFFNHGRSKNKYYRATVMAADRFLNKLGWIEGEPTLAENDSKEQK